MAKIVRARLITVLIAIGAIALGLSSGWQMAEAQTPTPTETPTAVATATATPTVTATSTPGTATATALPGTATATPRLPTVIAPLGGDVGTGSSGSDILILALVIGAVGLMSAGGVVAGYALVRRLI